MTIQLGIFTKSGQVVRDCEGRRVGRVFSNWGTEFVMWRGVFHLPIRVGHHEVDGIRGRNVYLDIHRRDLDSEGFDALKEIAGDCAYRVCSVIPVLNRFTQERW